ncbi:mannan endo-1,6-alpha-mannosidase [Aspergillus pseudoustus]|uniref:Mannan endo-1,6-alpha-mannosidase n=1 Tax=Aspergillus pseudoustus TaxID=1810923 RepID=A0ABR4J629_9EURO
MYFTFLGAVLALLGRISALQIQLDDPHSIRDAASETAHGALLWYAGNETGQIPGAFPEKMVGGQDLQWQAGYNEDFLPSNFSSYLGNDDQFFWGAAAMTAAEVGFPEDGDGFSWPSLAQAVFNSQTRRWDYANCGGGLRWQHNHYMAGWLMKDAISNGGFFQLAARLARYTNNNTYAEWAQKAWDWSASSPLLNTTTWNVADSTVWSYNYCAYLKGAAYMYNYTESAEWKRAVDGLLAKMLVEFFPERYGGGNIIFDICDPGIVSAWLISVTLVVPETHGRFFPKVQTSAQAAALSCSGAGNNSCSVKWSTQEWDLSIGMEQQISATFVLSSVLVSENTKSPRTSTTGGKSTSDPNAGTKEESISEPREITIGDRVGAGILTVLFVGLWGGMVMWMYSDIGVKIWRPSDLYSWKLQNKNTGSMNASEPDIVGVTSIDDTRLLP